VALVARMATFRDQLKKTLAFHDAKGRWSKAADKRLA
jgi:hypothetical protein